MNVIKHILILLCCTFFAQGQIDSTLVKETTGKPLKKLGKNALLQNDPNSAITFFEAYLKTAKKDAEARYLLGVAYYGIRNYEKAQNNFLNAYKTNKKQAPEALYYHAQMLKSNGKYDSAKIQFQAFKKEYKGKDKALKKQAGKEVSYCDSIAHIIAKENKIVITHLDASINKINTEASPVTLDANTLLFTSLRTDKKEVVSEDDTAMVLKRKLYVAKRVEDKWEFEGEYGKVFNNAGENIGNISLSADGKRMYFTRCKLNYKEEMICAIYVSEKRGEKWSEPVKLPKPVNSNKYSTTMPAVALDPVKGNDILYFVSNRKGGKGGLDIWYTVYDKKKKEYKVPKNAGSKINGPKNEISPFYDNETKSLYFSSDGWAGLGGYDVYKASGDGKRFTGIENVGMPVNSGADDIYYTISNNRSEGFLVSNRKGGNALKHSTCCDDIYQYKNLAYIPVLLKGNINDMLDPMASVKTANIEIYVKDKKTNEKYLVKTVKSDSTGNYTADLEAGQEYYMVVKKNDFLGSSTEVSTMGIKEPYTIEKDLHLIKKPKEAIHIPNIQYEFDRSNILESSKVSLDTTVLDLMLNNPELIIEIQSHTDNKGSDAYNLKLSQKRAESVVAYLISKGIAAKRLKAQGYGESKPIAPNQNADGSDNPDGRARNRRTDFKIIGVIDAEIINDSETE